MIYSPAWIREVTAQITATTPHSQEEKAAEGILRALADSGAVLTEAWQRCGRVQGWPGPSSKT